VFHCTKVSLNVRERFRVLTGDEGGGPIGLDGGTLSHSPEKYMDMPAFDGSAGVVCESSC
jgi:hypothetical protein